MVCKVTLCYWIKHRVPLQNQWNCILKSVILDTGLTKELSSLEISSQLRLPCKGKRRVRHWSLLFVISDMIWVPELCQGKFRLDIKKKAFTQLAWHWNGLSRELDTLPRHTEFKECLDNASRGMLWLLRLSCEGSEVRLQWLLWVPSDSGYTMALFHISKNPKNLCSRELKGYKYLSNNFEILLNLISFKLTDFGALIKVFPFLDLWFQVHS